MAGDGQARAASNRVSASATSSGSRRRNCARVGRRLPTRTDTPGGRRRKRARRNSRHQNKWAGRGGTLRSQGIGGAAAPLSGTHRGAISRSRTFSRTRRCLRNGRRRTATRRRASAATLGLAAATWTERLLLLSSIHTPGNAADSRRERRARGAARFARGAESPSGGRVPSHRGPDSGPCVTAM